jgi:hypothetical protein
MAVRPESRWWIVLLLLAGAIFGLSALALNRADVVWAAGQPRCPHCRSRVEAFSTRCAACREEYDWSASPDEDSPISAHSLSPLEERHLRARIKTLGEDVAVQRVADALKLPRAGVADYLKQVGSGRCGWCGGTGRDLAAGADATEKDSVCPACFGRRACVACAGDRRIRLGDAAAARDLGRYLQDVSAISHLVDLDEQRAEVRRLGQAFLTVQGNSGTLEAQQVLFAPQWSPDDPQPRRTVEACRARLDQVLRALPTP